MTTDHPPAVARDEWPSPLDAQALAALPFRWQDLPGEDRGVNAPNYPPRWIWECMGWSGSLSFALIRDR